MLENQYHQIFTQQDDSIFAEGSLDPLGLRMIWTSIGNKIFHNKLNTISSNIFSYTINLFHHSVIQRIDEEFAESIVNLHGKSPYSTKEDIHEGCVIFLECLLAHHLASSPSDEINGLSIPGVPKLRGIKISDPNHKMVKFLPIDRKDGILVRHNLLGIHGRHKGPFQQMNIFQKHNYYANTALWKKIQSIFNDSSWKPLQNILVNKLGNILLKTKHKSGVNLKAAVDEILDAELITAYRLVLQPKTFTQDYIIQFWEYHLGLNDHANEATLIYNYVKKHDGNADPKECILELTRDANYENLNAIKTVEPLLTSLSKIMDMLLLRGLTEINTSLQTHINKHINSSEINLDSIQELTAREYFHAAANARLNAFLQIIGEYKVSNNINQFIAELVAYHKRIMTSRGNVEWITVKSNQITQNKSFSYSEEYIEFINNHNWVNQYYIHTVNSLYKGLHHSNEVISAV